MEDLRNKGIQVAAMDVSQAESVAGAVKEILATSHRIDVLICNAGISFRFTELAARHCFPGSLPNNFDIFSKMAVKLRLRVEQSPGDPPIHCQICEMSTGSELIQVRFWNS